MFNKMNMRIKNFETEEWITDKKDLIQAMNQILRSTYGESIYSMNKNAVYQTIEYIKHLMVEAVKNEDWHSFKECQEILRQIII